MIQGLKTNKQLPLVRRKFLQVKKTFKFIGDDLGLNLLTAIISWKQESHAACIHDIKAFNVHILSLLESDC